MARTCVRLGRSQRWRRPDMKSRGSKLWQMSHPTPPINSSQRKVRVSHSTQKLTRESRPTHTVSPCQHLHTRHQPAPNHTPTAGHSPPLHILVEGVKRMRSCVMRAETQTSMVCTSGPSSGPPVPGAAGPSEPLLDPCGPRGLNETIGRGSLEVAQRELPDR